MKIILAHNYYQHPGGESRAFEAEVRLLRAYGHQVLTFRETNARISSLGTARLAAATLWNRDSYVNLRRLVRSSGAELVHFHNTFPLLSPSCYWAAKREGAAVVQTLHNYRLLCPNALLFRDGRPCTECVGRATAWPAVRYACYRGRRAATAATAAMLAIHRALGTWHHAVDAYIALTEFSRSQFVAAGLPEQKLYLKPNFLDPDPGPGSGAGGYALFAGRLSEEKGIRTLLDAWERLQEKYPLKIAGDGPLAPLVEKQVERRPRLEWLGYQRREAVLALMKEASCLVLPSLCYENFPLTLVEAAAAGLPVVASRTGAMATLVKPGQTGLLFPPGDAAALARQVERLFRQPDWRAGMRRAARQQYLRDFGPETNYRRLLNIYRSALAAAQSHGRHRAPGDESVEAV